MITDDNNINNITANQSTNRGQNPGYLIMIFPFIIAIFLLFGFTQLKSGDKKFLGNDNAQLTDDDSKIPKISFTALLAQDEFSSELRDTIYTDKDKYLELRIDEQMVYVHYKDGHIKSYPVSTGNKFLEKGIESRPGIFATFLKEELHLSSQFDDAEMYNYMPFNMGIGFHSLAGTGYYGNLGVRPSSHGCIRMRHEDAKALFKECPLGTLVLVHKGKTARVISFAPEGFKNDKEYTKEDYMNLLAYNLNSIYEGKYFINPPKRFIIDPAVIPKIGINIGSTEDISEKQQIPFAVNFVETKSDKLAFENINKTPSEKLDSSIAKELEINEEETSSLPIVDVSPDVVKKLVYNPIGILPYFPPNK